MPRFEVQRIWYSLQPAPCFFLKVQKQPKTHELLGKGLAVWPDSLSYRLTVSVHASDTPQAMQNTHQRVIEKKYRIITQFHPKTVLASLKLHSISSISCWYRFPLSTLCHGNEGRLALRNKGKGKWETLQSLWNKQCYMDVSLGIEND